MTRKEFEEAKARLLQGQRDADVLRMRHQIQLNKLWDELMMHANNLEETAIVLWIPPKV